MKCFICLWDAMNAGGQNAAWPQVWAAEEEDYPRDAVTSHNGTMLCLEHLTRVGDMDVVRPRA